MFDYSKLRGKIREVFHTESHFAKELGLSKTSLSAKLNGRVEFTQNEIAKATSILGIPPESIPDVFLMQKLSNLNLTNRKDENHVRNKLENHHGAKRNFTVGAFQNDGHR